MQIEIDLFLTPDELADTTRQNPKTGTIKAVDKKKADELPFESKIDRYEIEIEMEGEKYKWLPNKTSIRKLAKKFGRDSGNWIGKKIKLYRTEQNIRGEVKGVVNGEPLE